MKGFRCPRFRDASLQGLGRFPGGTRRQQMSAHLQNLSVTCYPKLFYPDPLLLPKGSKYLIFIYLP